MTLDLLLIAAVGLAVVHFGTPLAYYYLKKWWLNKPWNIRRDPSYKPRVSIIVPTYSEAGLIESKLDDLARQDYSRELLEIVVVDSASTDGTSEKVEEWARRNPGLKLKLIREPARRGKAFALNGTLGYASGDAVVVTDVDATWSSSSTLSEALSRICIHALVGMISLLSPFIHGVSAKLLGIGDKEDRDTSSARTPVSRIRVEER